MLNKICRSLDYSESTLNVLFSTRESKSIFPDGRGTWKHSYSKVSDVKQQLPLNYFENILAKYVTNPDLGSQQINRR